MGYVPASTSYKDISAGGKLTGFSVAKSNGDIVCCQDDSLDKCYDEETDTCHAGEPAWSTDLCSSSYKPCGHVDAPSTWKLMTMIEF